MSTKQTIAQTNLITVEIAETWGKMAGTYSAQRNNEQAWKATGELMKAIEGYENKAELQEAFFKAAAAAEAAEEAK